MGDSNKDSNNGFTFEDYMEMGRKHREFMQKHEEFLKEIRNEELKKMGIDPDTQAKEDRFHGDCDSPYTMENSTVGMLYIITMIGGAIFKDRVLIWIAATVMLVCHFFRHEIRRKIWDRNHKNKK